MKFFTAVAAIFCAGAAALAADSPDVKKFTFSNDVEVYAIRDKDMKMSSSLFTDYTKSSSLKKDKLEKEYPASCNCFVMRHNFKVYLIDAGNYDPKCSLVTKLASINIRPKAVNYILITHLHPDHVGGLIDKDGAAVFPDAQVCLLEDEWKDFSSKQNPNEILRRFRDAYKGRIRSLSSNELIVSGSGVFSMKAPGHTPGHCFYRQGKLRFVGDVVHAVDLQVKHPEYCASFDNDKKAAYQTRLSFLETMSREGYVVFGAHIPFPGVGYITKESSGYRFDPYPTKK